MFNFSMSDCCKKTIFKDILSMWGHVNFRKGSQCSDHLGERRQIEVIQWQVVPVEGILRVYMNDSDNCV